MDWLWCMYSAPVRMEGCSNLRGISLLGVVGKLYDRVLIKRLGAGTECAIPEEQCGFRQGRGCMDQVYSVRQVCEKYLGNEKCVFWAFMDLAKAYEKIERQYIWQMQRVYGVRGNLLKAVQSFYIDSRTCVRVGMDVSEYFPVNVGLRQGCVMSPWLFNVCIDGVRQRGECKGAWKRAGTAEFKWYRA